MKTAVGMIVYNESYMLSLLLHRYIRGFDGIVAVDTGSTDGSSSILESYGAKVISADWVDFSTARNTCLNLAESLGYDYMMTMDADEALLAEDVAHIKKLTELQQVFSFPRLEFIDTKDYINPIFYPDTHVRLIPLRKGFRYVGAVHEIVTGPKAPVMVPYIPIYHYSKLKERKVLELKYENQHRTARGFPRLKQLEVYNEPDYSQGPKVPFYGRQPL